MNDYVKHYNDHYKREGDSGSGQLVWQPQYEIWLKAGYKPGMSVLDYGCGVGIMTESGIRPEDYNGVDISEEAIKLAHKRYPEYSFVVCKLGELLPVPSNVCVAQSVFTHVPKDLVLDCLRDVKGSFNQFAVIDVLLGEDDPNDYHVRRFNEPEWLDYLKQAGLAGERIAEHDFVGYNHIFYRVTHDY